MSRPGEIHISKAEQRSLRRSYPGHYLEYVEGRITEQELDVHRRDLRKTGVSDQELDQMEHAALVERARVRGENEDAGRRARA